MNDDGIDAMLRDEIEAWAPDPAWIEARVGETRRIGSRQVWVWPLIAVAAVAALILTAIPLGSDSPEAGSAASPDRAAEAVPDGSRLLQLSPEVATAPGFPRVGDRVDLLVALMSPRGDPQAVTLMGDVQVTSVDPVVVAVMPDAAERIAHAEQVGLVALAVVREAWNEMLVRPDRPPLAPPGSYVDILATSDGPRGAETKTALTEVLVAENLGDQLRVVVTSEQGERLALAQHLGRITTTVHP